MCLKRVLRFKSASASVLPLTDKTSTFSGKPADNGTRYFPQNERIGVLVRKNNATNEPLSSRFWNVPHAAQLPRRDKTPSSPGRCAAATVKRAVRVLTKQKFRTIGNRIFVFLKTRSCPTKNVPEPPSRLAKRHTRPSKLNVTDRLQVVSTCLPG